MRHLVLLSALLISGSASAADPAGPPAAATPGTVSTDAVDPFTGEPCKPSNVVPARPGEPPRANKLGELPSGDLQLAVLRGEPGCFAPVIVRRGYGLDAAPPPDAPRSPSPVRARPL